MIQSFNFFANDIHTRKKLSDLVAGKTTNTAHWQHPLLKSKGFIVTYKPNKTTMHVIYEKEVSIQWMSTQSLTKTTKTI